MGCLGSVHQRLKPLLEAHHQKLRKVPTGVVLVHLLVAILFPVVRWLLEVADQWQVFRLLLCLRWAFLSVVSRLVAPVAALLARRSLRRE